MRNDYERKQTDCFTFFIDDRAKRLPLNNWTLGDFLRAKPQQEKEPAYRLTLHTLQFCTFSEAPTPLKRLFMVSPTKPAQLTKKRFYEHLLFFWGVVRES